MFDRRLLELRLAAAQEEQRKVSYLFEFASAAIQDALSLQRYTYEVHGFFPHYLPACTKLGLPKLCISYLELQHEALPHELLAKRATSLDGAGVLLGCFFGGGTLSALRQLLAIGNTFVPRIFPMLTAQSVASLLQDLGLYNVVVNKRVMKVDYGNVWSLLRDLRAMGATNVLSQTASVGMSRAQYTQLQEAEGQFREQFELVIFLATINQDEFDCF